MPRWRKPKSCALSCYASSRNQRPRQVGIQLHCIACRLIAPYFKDLLNVWLARLVGLFSASCFQYNPAVQQRALVALGTLMSGARSGEVEDDFMVSICCLVRAWLPAESFSKVSTSRCHPQRVGTADNSCVGHVAYQHASVSYASHFRRLVK